MAFSRTPEQSTYQTKQIRLVKELNSRDSNSNKDEDYINLCPEIIKNKNTKEDELYLIKRDGSEEFIASVGASPVRGLFFWEMYNQVFVAVADDIRIYNATTGAIITTLNAAFGTTGGHVGFCEFLYDNNTVQVVATDGITLQTIDNTGTRVASADVDLPGHKPYPVFLDGYLFILKADSADLYNSDLNDPLAWTAGNFLTAEIIPDRASYISRLNNYLVVFGAQSIEYFWDAAIATGSPLQRNDTPIKLSGLVGGMASLGNRIFFVGSQNESEPDIFVLEDFKMTPIGTEAIRRHLASITIVDTHTIQASIISRQGHNFYVFNTGTSCYSYDIESKLWSRWTWKATSNFDLENAVNCMTGGGYQTYFSLGDNSTIYRFDSALYQDDGTTFPATVVTDIEEFNTYNQKTMHRLVVWADRPTTSATGTLYWTDDDYQSYSNGLSIDLDRELPCAYRLGRFRRRAFKFTFTQNQPLRLKGFEVDINMGQH